MKYLLDTCVISELIKKSPNANITDWILNTDEHDLFVSVLTIGEIHKGIEKLAPGKRKKKLHAWVNQDLCDRFAHRILDFDLSTAITWGVIQAKSEIQGKTMPAIDGRIAATGISYGLTIVTRNISDMEISEVPLINPWE